MIPPPTSEISHHHKVTNITMSSTSLSPISSLQNWLETKCVGHNFEIDDFLAAFDNLYFLTLALVTNNEILSPISTCHQHLCRNSKSTESWSEDFWIEMLKRLMRKFRELRRYFVFNFPFKIILRI